MSQLKEITQEVIIRPIKIGKMRPISGKFTDKLRKQQVVITSKDQFFTGDQVDKVPGYEIKNIMFNEATRQYNYSYKMKVDENGQVNREAMEPRELQKMQVCEAWAMHPQMQHIEAANREDALRLNPNLVDPWFTIEFVGRINLTKTLSMFEKFNVFKSFFELPNEEKLDCCYWFGHNPVEDGKANVTAMMVSMVDFNNGIIQSSAKNRERFLNVFLPNKDAAIEEAIVNKAFKLNIVSYKVDGWYVERQNIGINEENAKAKIQKDRKLFEFIKNDLATKQLKVEDDWVKSIKTEAFKLEDARETIKTATDVNQVEQQTEDVRLKARAKELGIKWHHMTPADDRLKKLIADAEAKLIKDAEK